VKVYRTMQEMGEDQTLPGFAPEVLAFQEAMSKQSNLTGVFEADFGGDVFLIESLEDLDKIDTLVEDLNLSSNRWLNIRETASSFDQAAYLPGRAWAIMWMATNNNGGPTYFIPKAIVDQCPNIEASMKLSSKDGQIEELNESNRYEDH
jgi:hypothetical protein